MPLSSIYDLRWKKKRRGGGGGMGGGEWHSPFDERGHGILPEPVVVEGLFRSDALSRIEREHPFEQVGTSLVHPGCALASACFTLSAANSLHPRWE